MFNIGHIVGKTQFNSMFIEKSKSVGGENVNTNVTHNVHTETEQEVALESFNCNEAVYSNT